ncbi:site-specific DNA-methyltransferase [Mesomycoplasma lagogenitalium]|uniref:Methyltransferase n=1 Tax=Mesomycoplasma lagogenitalium TaxID=171286 RepID=A0ABY8LU57_9BACT|nr:site-specific DNA-methyltransferase [Mesomycoplasma lagogenitalium]WGI36773.1 DNA methyltransferase [Mesomycoplasma lagogenitalium]
MKENKIPINQIILDDNINFMKSLPDECIDLIFADPPYNMNLQKELLRPNGLKFEGVNDEWDKFNSLEHYKEESLKWIKECLRILKKNGSFWIIGSYQNIHIIGNILQNLNAWIIGEIIWEKTNPVPNFGGTRFVNDHETLLWVVKNKNSSFTFNYKTMKFLNKGKQMKSIWNFAICSGKERLKDENGKKIHSTQKPLQLLERIILASSKYNDLVFDPFIGTATTAHAAKKWGRNYLGVELFERYYNASIERLKNVEENMEDDNVKFASFDKKQEKVTFKDLIDANLINVEENIYIQNLKLKFNIDGTITYLNEKYSPNALCKKIFNKPTNAWEVIKINNQKISEIRKKYRDKN